jgi:hypothetical protein
MFREAKQTGGAAAWLSAEADPEMPKLRPDGQIGI